MPREGLRSDPNTELIELEKERGGILTKMSKTSTAGNSKRDDDTLSIGSRCTNWAGLSEIDEEDLTYIDTEIPFEEQETEYEKQKARIQEVILKQIQKLRKAEKASLSR